MLTGGARGLHGVDPFKLILVDLELPDGNGMELLAELVHYPATKISVFVFLTPVFALLFGALWLGEPVTPGLVAALVLVAAGIVLVNRRPAAAA